jgi:hypothetical protein
VTNTENDWVYEAIVTVLTNVKELFESRPADRETYRLVLGQLASFYRVMGSDVAAMRLLDLALALHDLDQGTVRPLLSRAKIKNRSPDSSEEWGARAHAALALESLKRGGEPLKSASREIASSTGLTARNLVTWRHELMAGRIKNELAMLTFKHGLADLEKVADAQGFRQLAAVFSQAALTLAKPR